MSAPRDWHGNPLMPSVVPPAEPGRCWAQTAPYPGSRKKRPCAEPAREGRLTCEHHRIHEPAARRLREETA
jgi:hypothetical protein